VNKSTAYDIIRTYFADKPVKKVMVFGSYARNEQDQKSDIDVIVSPEMPLGLFALARFRRDLSDLLGISVDLGTEKGISTHVLPYIKDEMEVVYEQ
jgi:predicted nucleotidyltransferase